MALSSSARLRIRIALYILFAISYTAGAYVFAKHFHNTLAVCGFSAAVVFLIFVSVLHLLPDEKLSLAMPPGSLTRIVFQSAILVCFSAFVGAALYALAEGVRLQQSWTGGSYYCSFIALLNASKWCFLCGYRIAHLRRAYCDCDTDEDDEEEGEDKRKDIFEGATLTQDNIQSKSNTL